MTILVVEDDDDVRVTALAMVGHAGFTAVGAPDAERAFEVLNSDETVDVLFSDIVMPGTHNGIDLARRATKKRPDLRVLLTSGRTCNLEPFGEVAARWQVLRKPYHQADLRNALDSLTNERSPS